MTYVETLRSALNSAGYTNTMIIAADSNWDIASDILANPTFAEAVYGIGLFIIKTSFSFTPLNASYSPFFRFIRFLIFVSSVFLGFSVLSL